LNAGTIENKGWEVQFNATPLKPSSYTLIMAKPIINQTGSASRIGKYQRTGESNNVIGDINADWKAG
jgi:hypothetical protein